LAADLETLPPKEKIWYAQSANEYPTTHRDLRGDSGIIRTDAEDIYLRVQKIYRVSV
jgi:hypothetical protein